MMGGSIWLESEPGKGSTFYFIAQLEPVQASQSMNGRGDDKLEEPLLESITGNDKGKSEEPSSISDSKSQEIPQTQNVQDPHSQNSAPESSSAPQIPIEDSAKADVTVKKTSDKPPSNNLR